MLNSANIKDLESADHNKDKLLIYILIAHMAVIYCWAIMEQHLHALIPATVAYLVTLLVYRRQSGTFLSRAAITVCFIVCSATLIHLADGMVELHFHIFALLALLAIYYDWRLIVLAGTLFALHHLFALLNNNELYQVYQANSSLGIYLLHMLFVVLTCLSLCYLINVQRSSFQLIHRQNEALLQEVERHKQTAADLRVSMEKERELSELKSRFISTTSHEFRTPLTGILSNAELLEHYSNRFSEAKKQELVQRIESSVKYMTSLLDDVLIVGKAETGRLEFKPAQVDLPALCRAVLDEISREQRKPHPLNFEVKGDISPIIGDARLLRLTLKNLIDNAMKYSPDGGQVDVTVTYQPEKVVLEVRDNGIGIPLEDQARLFENFHRAGNVGTIAGTGLGLSIVRNSVALHNGTVSIDSRVGAGTSVKICLPDAATVRP